MLLWVGSWDVSDGALFTDEARDRWMWSGCSPYDWYTGLFYVGY